MTRPKLIFIPVACCAKLISAYDIFKWFRKPNRINLDSAKVSVF